MGDDGTPMYVGTDGVKRPVQPRRKRPSHAWKYMPDPDPSPHYVDEVTALRAENRELKRQLHEALQLIQGLRDRDR